VVGIGYFDWNENLTMRDLGAIDILDIAFYNPFLD